VTSKSRFINYKNSTKNFAEAAEAQSKNNEVKNEKVEKEELTKEEVKNIEAESKPSMDETKNQDSLNSKLTQINFDKLSEYKQIIDGFDKNWNNIAKEKEL
jgi:hypothetical protein